MGEEDHSVGLHKAELRPAVRNYKVMHVKALKKKKKGLFSNSIILAAAWAPSEQ